MDIWALAEEVFTEGIPHLGCNQEKKYHFISYWERGKEYFFFFFLNHTVPADLLGICLNVLQTLFIPIRKKKNVSNCWKY